MEKKKTSHKTSDAKHTFEAALQRLEEIARNLEEGGLGLEESIKEFEQGIALSKFCHSKLEEAERKIEILQKGSESQVTVKPVKVKNDTGEIDEDEELQGSLL